MGILDLWNKPSDNNDNISKVILQAINEKKMLKIKYQKYDGTSSERILSQVDFNNEFEADGYHKEHITAYCHLRQEKRSFKISRITWAEINS